ncbi:MAG: 2OG-Fe(II) oxygenase [Wenzhouxiangella sp.]
MSNSASPILDQVALSTIPTASFREAIPYPWLNPEGVLTDQAFELLRTNMPPLDIMKTSFGRKRAHGQKPHDRYALEYHPDLNLHPAWHQLIDELNGAAYQDWLARLFATRRFRLTYHWHYTPQGASVSPHCDARRKLGSHIFYFNTPEEWDPAWGGETVILDDGGRFRRSSAPDFEDFTQAWTANAMGNRSLLFQRQGNSWHGVRPLSCPEDRLRKVFIVVVNADTLGGRIRRMFHKPEGY